MYAFRLRRQPFAWLCIAGMALAAGCSRAPNPETGAEGSVEAKREWQSAQARAEFDQLRNRLMHSQTDR